MGQGVFGVSVGLILPYLFYTWLNWSVQLHKTIVVLVVISSHTKVFLEKQRECANRGGKVHSKKPENEVSEMQTWASRSEKPCLLPGMDWTRVASSPSQSHPEMHTSKGCCSDAVPSLFCRENILGKTPRPPEPFLMWCEIYTHEEGSPTGTVDGIKPSPWSL